jgi:tetratricopeptide (TPR) repeat protein
MKTNTKLGIAALALTVFFLVTPEVSAQQAGRIAGTVTTPDGTPIEGVTITISEESLGRDIVKTTNKKGKFTVSHSQGGMRFQYKLEKEGYQTIIVQVAAPIGGTAMQDFVMPPVAEGPPEGEASAGGGSGGGDPAIRTYNEGVEAQRLGDLDLAAEKFEKAAKMRPDLGAAQTALGAVRLQLEDFAGAAAAAEAALAIDPEDVRAMQIQFDAYRNLGDEAKASEAAAALRNVGDLEQAAARIFNEGVDAYQAGDIATAQSKFQQVVELAPDMVQPYVALGQISLSQGSPSEALAMAGSALELEPDNTQALKIAFDGARLAGNNEAAGRALDRLVELEPEWITTTLFDHAGKLFNDNQAAAAALELEYVVKADPELARAHYLLGMAYFNSGRVAEGKAHLEKFIELAPDDPDVEIAKGLLTYDQ